MSDTTTTCPAECIGWTEEQLDQNLNVSAAAHEAVGMEHIAAMLRGRSGELYAQERDDEAKVWRYISGLVRDLAAAQRERQKKLAKEYGIDA